MLQRYVSKELTHFVGRELPCDERYNLLVTILKEGMLRGRGMAPHLDDDDVIVISSRHAFNTEAPVVCFCDIPVNDLGLHIKKYGKFGLSFLKGYLIPKRVSPVFYVAADSRTISRGKKPLRGECFDEMLQLYDRLADRIRSELRNECQYKTLVKEFEIFDSFFFNQILAFRKPFINYLEESDSDNFYMEREWRVLGRVAFEVADVHRIIVPNKHYAARLRKDIPNYEGQLNFTDEFEVSADG